MPVGLGRQSRAARPELPRWLPGWQRGGCQPARRPSHQPRRAGGPGTERPWPPCALAAGCRRSSA
eukprot:8477637-Alexandrium_andersonii.AAC.1